MSLPLNHFREGRELYHDRKNFIRYGEGSLLLPWTDQDFQQVEVIFMDQSQYRITSRYVPIRFGNHVGSSVILGGGYDNSDMSPSFYYDAKKGVWLLDAKGYICFAEIEVNHLPRQL